MTAQKNPPADDAASQQDAGSSDEVLKLCEELARMKDLAARAQADLQNAKMRMKKEGQEIRVFAVQALIERLLPTIDNFRRAFDHLPADLKSHDWVKGLAAVEQQLLRDLEAVGLKPIDALGKPADPARHEILQTAPGKEGIVLQLVENGYELSGKVIKPAKVVVGDGSAE